MILLCEILFYGIFFFAGTCIFSFLNVIIYRVPLNISFVRGFSYCPECGQKLRPWDLIPVFSYLFLGGRCRGCKAKIGLRDMLVELLGGGVAVLCILHYGYNAHALLAFCFFCILSVVAFLDLDTMEIPDECEIAVVLLAVPAIFVMPEISLLSRLIGAVCVSVPLLLMTLAIPDAFGGGDIKLMAACGLFLGWKITLVSTALGILFGGIYGIFLLAGKRAGRKDHFAFGPFLCMGMGIGLLYGEELLQLYLSTIV